MRRRSLRRRLITAVLLLECALVAAMSAAMLLFMGREQLQAFDLTIHGRADSLLGSVRDAEDPGDNVEVNPEALDLRRGDLWMVENAGGRVLAGSHAWSMEAIRSFGQAEEPHDFRYQGRSFRGLALHGVRQIDAEGTNPGIARPVTVFYAAPLQPVYDALSRTTRFLAVAGGLLLLFTGLVLAWLLRRGLAPLEQLSSAAAAITPQRLYFQAPAGARATSELAVLAGALESATQRLREAFEQQQVFVHDAAHELKTAVTIVKSSLQLLASRPRTSREYARGLETSLADCARMEELVQRMLQLARFEQRSGRASATCNIAETARDVAAQMETLAEIRQVAIVIDAPASLAAPLSAEACGSLIANLLLNAVQHTPEGGRVEASLAEGDGIRLEVRDTGSGIAREDLPHLFERFWRGDRSRARSTGGAGLGLPICKAIVDSCGGSIEVKSRLGEGTCVEVTLPASPARPSSAQPARQTVAG